MDRFVEEKLYPSRTRFSSYSSMVPQLTTGQPGSMSGKVGG